MTLRDLQAMFAEALVLPSSIAREGAWPARGETAFTGSTRLSPIEQLDVYREQFWIRHVDCLVEDFPALDALVGRERFEAIVAEYLAAHPPVDFMLRNLGAHLAEFLEKVDPLLADLARVEWAFVDAFDAPDAPPLDPKRVAAITEDEWPRARLVLHPSLQRLRLVYPAHKIRQKFRQNEGLERVPAEAAFVVIYRRDLLLHTEELDAHGFEMLARLANGELLGDAGEALAKTTTEDIEARIGEWFTRWSALGWISEIVVSAERS